MLQSYSVIYSTLLYYEDCTGYAFPTILFTSNLDRSYYLQLKCNSYNVLFLGNVLFLTCELPFTYLTDSTDFVIISTDYLARKRNDQLETINVQLLRKKCRKLSLLKHFLIFKSAKNVMISIFRNLSKQWCSG